MKSGQEARYSKREAIDNLELYEHLPSRSYGVFLWQSKERPLAVQSVTPNFQIAGRGYTSY